MSGDFQLYRRSNSSKWWMRFSIKGEGQIRKSLGTANEVEAYKLATKEYHRAVMRSENGLRVAQKSFTTIAEEFIAWRHQQSQNGEKRADKGKRDEALIRRYFIPYFANKSIDAIRDADIVRYQEWRRTYWQTGPGEGQLTYDTMRGGKKLTLRTTHMRKPPSLGTLRGENITLNEIFGQAVSWGYLDRNLRPEVTMPKAPPSPRPSFSIDEMTRLHKLAETRTLDPKVNDEVRRDRTILLSFILIATNTGMRPTELKNLIWDDVLGYRDTRDKPIGERDIRLRARGKGKSRELVPQRGAIPVRRFDSCGG